MGLLLFLATLIAYAPALRGSLLWDDDGHVTKPYLQSIEGLRRIWFDLGATQQYYPVLHSAFWLEHRVWGDSVLGYHLTNVVLHVVAAVLVVAIMRRLALPGGWLAGFLFALHPVPVEAVAWISEQKSTLSTVFYLAAALVYLRYDANRKRADYFVALTLFLLALASKTVTATLPPALLVIFWWQRGRIEWRRDLQPLVPWLAIGAGAGIFTAWVERTYIGAQGSDFALNPLGRVLLAGRVIWFYFWKLVWPANLMFFYPHWKIDGTVWWQYLFPIGVAAVAAAFVWLSRWNRGALAAFLFFTGTLFPVLGFLNVYPFVYSYVADHFAYLASLGLIVPVAAALTIAARRLPFDGRIAAAAFLTIPAILTWRESRSYKDVEILYRTTLARNPESWISHNNLGDVLMKDNRRIPEAVGHFQAALRLKPDSAEAMNNLGSADSRLGRYAGAVAKFETALRFRPKFPEAEDNLGAALEKIPGRASQAMPHFEIALQQKPDFAEAHSNLGVALAGIGRREDAIREYETALSLDPNLTEAHNNLASALAETPGHEDDAIAEYRAALAANPDSSEAHSNLGNVLSKSGKQAEALGEFEAALRFDPKSAEAHNGLGVALAAAGKTQEAIAEYETALRLNPNLGEAHNDLGTLLAQSGHMSEAAKQFEAAVASRPDSVETHMNLANALGELPGRQAEAAEQYEFVVRARPDLAEPHYFLGIILAKMPGRTSDAIAQFEAALKIKPDPEVQALVDKMKSGRSAR